MRLILPLLLFISLGAGAQLRFAFKIKGMQGDTITSTKMITTTVNIDTLASVVYVKEEDSLPAAFKILYYKRGPDGVVLYILQTYTRSTTLHMLVDAKNHDLTIINGRHLTVYSTYSPHETSRLRARGPRPSK